MKHISLSALLVGFAASCASSRAVDETPALPFHVAVAPVQLDRIDASTTGPADGDGLRIDFDSREAQLAISRALEDAGFAVVSRLEYPTDEDRVRLELPENRDQREKWLAWAGAEADADLLLTAKLTYPPSFQTSASTAAVGTVMLYLLGGPLCWIVPDRTYRLRANLRADLFDLNAGEYEDESGYFPFADLREIAKDGALPDGFEAKLLTELTSIQPSFRQTNLNLWNRADGGRDYLVSVLVPPTWVARRTEKARSTVEDVVLEELANELRSELLGRRADVLRPRTVDLPLWFEPDEPVPAVRDGRVFVRGKAYLRERMVITGKPTCEIDGERHDLVEIEQSEWPDYRAFAVEASAPAPADGVLSIALDALGREQYRRTYSLRVSPARGGTY